MNRPESSVRRYRIDLAECFPRPADATERLREMGFPEHITNSDVWEPTCVTTRDVEYVRELHPDIPHKGAVDIDLQGMGAISIRALRGLYAEWPNACFITSDPDHMEALAVAIGRRDGTL